MASLLLGTVLFCYTLTTLAGSFTLVKEYSGSTFFDDWDYYGNYDNLTGGWRCFHTVCFIYIR